jgi:hypothetical protein
MEVILGHNQFIDRMADEFFAFKPEDPFEFPVDPEQAALFVGDDNAFLGIFEKLFEICFFFVEFVLVRA